MFQPYIDMFGQALRPAQLDRIVEDFTDVGCVHVISPMKIGKSTTIPMAISDSLREGAILYVITSTRSDARLMGEIVRPALKTLGYDPTHVGTLFRPRIASEDTEKENNRIVYVSAEYAIRTDLLDSIRYAVVDYGCAPSPALMVALSALRMRRVRGESLSLAVVSDYAFTDTTFWEGIDCEIIDIPNTHVRTPLPITIHQGESAASIARRLASAMRSGDVLVYESSTHAAETTYRTLIDLVTDGLLAAEVIHLTRHVPYTLKQKLSVTSWDSVRIIVASAHACPLPYLHRVCAVVSSGEMVDAVYQDHYLYNYDLRQLTHSELRLQRKAVCSRSPYGPLLINLSTESPARDFIRRDDVIRLVTEAARAGLSLSSIRTGSDECLTQKLSRAVKTLDTFGLIYTRGDRVYMSPTCRAVMDGVNGTLRAAAAHHQAMAVDILAVALPYIAILPKARSIDSGIRRNDYGYTLCTTSDLINDLAILITEHYHGNHHDYQVKRLMSALGNFVRLTQPKGLAAEPDLSAWISYDKKTPPRVVTDVTLYRKMVSVIIRSQCDQTYMFSPTTDRLVVGFGDHIPLTNKTSVRRSPERNYPAACAQSLNVSPVSKVPFMVGRNVTLLTQEDIDYFLATCPNPDTALKSLTYMEAES